MYKYFSGIVQKQIQNYSYLITNQFFGLEIFTPYNLEELTPVNFYLHQDFSQDSGFSFFGFQSIEELDFFQLLISVPGLGAKTTIKLIGSLGFGTVGSAINKKDTKSLMVVSGIGGKIATRIVNDLEGKIPTIFLGSDYELVSTLTSIGYKQSDIVGLLSLIDPKLPLEDRLQEAIKKLATI